MKIIIQSLAQYEKEREQQAAAEHKAKTEGTYCGEIPHTYGNAAGGIREDLKKPGSTQ